MRCRCLHGPNIRMLVCGRTRLYGTECGLEVTKGSRLDQSKDQYAESVQDHFCGLSPYACMCIIIGAGNWIGLLGAKSSKTHGRVASAGTSKRRISQCPAVLVRRDNGNRRICFTATSRRVAPKLCGGPDHQGRRRRYYDRVGKSASRLRD